MKRIGILKNFFSMWIATMIASLLTFITQIIITRNFTVEEYGAYATILNLINLLATLGSFGIGDYLIKSYFKDKKNFFFQFKKSMGLLKITLIFTLIINISLLVFFDDITKILLLIFIPSLLTQCLVIIVNALQQIKEKFYLISIYTLIIQLFRLLSVLLGIYFSLDFIPTLIILNLLSLVLTLDFIGKIKKTINRVENLNEEEPPSKSILSGVFPYFISGIMYYIYYQSDIILINTLINEYSAGIYSIAYSVLSLFYIFPTILYRKLFLSKVHKWTYESSALLKDFFIKNKVLMLVVSILIIIFTFLFAEYLIITLFGQQYSESLSVLLILIFCVPFRFLYAVSGTIMSTEKLIKYKMRYQIYTGCINLICNIILIPILGIKGAAISTLFSEMLLYLFMEIKVKRFLKNFNNGDINLYDETN
jgi:O-antigen/teichoic acid export membrane protein